MILFHEAFETFIRSQVVIGSGFQQQKRVQLRNVFSAFPCGYFTEYANGYKLIVSGESLGSTPVQEAMILNPAGITVARDT